MCNKIKILTLLCFFSLNFISKKAYAEEYLKLDSQVQQGVFLDTSIVKDKVFYNADSAHKKGINTKWKKVIRGGMVFYGFGIVILAAAVNQSNFGLSQKMAITGLGVIAAGIGPFFRQRRYNDAEKINELLGMDLDAIKNRFGSKIEYDFVTKETTEYLTFKHIQIVTNTYTEINRFGGAQTVKNKSRLRREYQVFFDQNGKVNFARFRYFGPTWDKGWRESKRL